MCDASRTNVTRLLRSWGSGNKEAFDQLIPIVYDELHRLAHMYIARERAEILLNTTALINEAYMRLVDLNKLEWQDRSHFFAVSARQMRRILVDYARKRAAKKRGGKVLPVTLDEGLLGDGGQDVDLLQLDDALATLSTFDERKSQVVEMRFFGGMSVEETATALSVSKDTVLRDWRLAKSWLLREMSRG
jgi:RNA polymerase sigma factor (TIGR02999 family)